MGSNAFLMLSLALLLAAAAVALWLFAGKQQQTRKMAEHLQQSLERSAAASAGFNVRESAASAFDNSVADALLLQEARLAGRCLQSWRERSVPGCSTVDWA